MFIKLFMRYIQCIYLKPGFHIKIRPTCFRVHRGIDKSKEATQLGIQAMYRSHWEITAEGIITTGEIIITKEVFAEAFSEVDELEIGNFGSVQPIFKLERS